MNLRHMTLMGVLFLLIAQIGFAVDPIPEFENPSENMGTFFTQSALMVGLSMAPFMVMLLTSFLKIIVVLSLLRNATGLQNVPPNQVLNGMALLMTIYVMYPVGAQIYDEAYDLISNPPTTGIFSEGSPDYIINIVNKAKEPFRDFMVKNSELAHRDSFLEIANNSFPPNVASTLTNDSFIVLIPSYITSQLKFAFEIGVMIYLPFFIVDLVVSNVLLAMGMMMLSPMTISTPLKILLLVMLDGWTILVQGLVLSFNK